MAPPDIVPPSSGTGITPPDSSKFEKEADELGEKNLGSSAEVRSSPIPDVTGSYEGQPVTVHQFLQEIMKKPCRKYGRRNQLATVELGVHRSKGSSPSSISCDDDSQNDHSVSSPQRARPVRRNKVLLRRRKRIAKPLAQRLLEADVFSTGAFTRPTVEDPAHTSTRRPLQFVTSLHLTPSLETRIYKRHQVFAGGSTSARIIAVSDSPGAIVTPGSALDRDTVDTYRARRGGDSGALLTSGKRVSRARGKKRDLARSSAGLFQFVPLPLVKIPSRGCAASTPHYPFWT